MKDSPSTESLVVGPVLLDPSHGVVVMPPRRNMALAPVERRDRATTRTESEFLCRVMRTPSR